MLNKSLIIASGIFISSLLSVSSFAADGTSVQPGNYTPAKSVVVHTNECKRAGNIMSKMGPGTVGWQKSACPTGYMPRVLHISVDTGMYPDYNWQFECCKSEVAYPQIKS